MQILLIGPGRDQSGTVHDILRVHDMGNGLNSYGLHSKEN